MKIALLVSIGLISLSFGGCSSLPAFLGGPVKDIQAFLTAQAAGTYIVAISKDGKPLLNETWICTQADGQLTGCHKQAKP